MLPREGKSDLIVKWIPYIILVLLIVYAEVTKR